MLTLALSRDTEARLRQQAESAGKDLASYASELLERAATRTSLEEVLAPLRSQFAESGTSDEELIRQITAARAAYRADQAKSP
jgi:hypothetical protein